ncbi:DUF7146 domain-containing protein [Prosthecomicrobium sp. N25]|uniref:DUF7146 domain-containing protein n=1 Tax=Prosthecomicrobium sp. N25 TaxID=3129254 RepID=UPI0030783815
MRAEQLAKMLTGHRVGSGFLARCPAHDDRDPSLSIREGRGGKVLVHCHAGCTQADVVAALEARGLWTGSSGSGRRADAAPASHFDDLQDGAKRTEAALAIWHHAQPAERSPVEQYLKNRSITLPAPAALRFHPGLKHPKGGVWPAMVALVTRGGDGDPVAIHRTFLAACGLGKAPTTPSKMMLGPVRGGAVRLAPSAERLMVGEGIETVLSAMQATGMPGWAALSASGLKTLILPPSVREVIVLADGDEVGYSAAEAAGRGWTREGRRVRIARPPAGTDFNDVLLGIPGSMRGAAA